MPTVKGVVRNGIVEPLDALDVDEGAEVTILVPRRKGARKFSDFAGAWAEAEGDDEMWHDVMHRRGVRPRAGP